MRLWSFNPSFLDNKCLVATWREALLAQKVLTGTTNGYTKHPQLKRFLETENPLESIGTYLHFLHQESVVREYTFNRELIMFPPASNAFVKLKVTEGQLEYETKHFLTKAAKRDRELWCKLNIEPMLGGHPMFESIPGGLEEWEIIPPPKKKRQSNKRKETEEIEHGGGEETEMRQRMRGHDVHLGLSTFYD